MTQQYKNLLIVTQKVNKNDAVLGFFHTWIEAFSKQFETVRVICLEEGQHDLPKNVTIFSLGKEKKQSRIQYMWRFYSYIWSERDSYDVVFVHMNPVYVILGGLLWKMLNKRIGLWYVHKMVDMKLRIAVLLADVVFTASKESFRLETAKLRNVGHGIDVTKFSPTNQKKPITRLPALCEIVSIGRISKTKNQLAMIEAVRILQTAHFPVSLSLVGSGLTPDDQAYEATLRKYVKEHQLEKLVRFVGDVPPSDIADWYQRSDMFINLSLTGSLDKAILEAMACGLHVITSNEAFKNIVPAENFIHNDPDAISNKILELSAKTPNPDLRAYVVQNHDIKNLIPLVSRILKSEESTNGNQ